MGTPSWQGVEGRLLPFFVGSFVEFKPSETKYHVSGQTARMQSGVFMGYESHPCQTWNGEYRVLDLSDFAGNHLMRKSPRCRLAVRRTTPRLSASPDMESCSRLRERYERDNDALAGIEASTHYK